MTKKIKVWLLVITAVLVVVAAGVIVAMVNALNPPATVGEMTVESSGETIIPVTNILKYNTKDTSGGNAPLKPEDIYEELPEITYDGDIIVNYSTDTLDNFVFAMYKDDFTKLYADSNHYIHPEESGTYIVKIMFSWGYREDNSILTENYFSVVYP